MGIESEDGRVQGREWKEWKNVGILQQSGWCERGRVRNVAGNARASSVCKNLTETFLILDIADRLSTHIHTYTTGSAFLKCRVVKFEIFSRASFSQIKSFCFPSFIVNKEHVKYIKFIQCYSCYFEQ
ncbi:hypothetical protein CRENBAI_000397 [Crenichthys baileyi]|uniref:Uncharacterized protein n=1 Tax=Crenichthys baileyi TaxID=28760 RepID=A0AAV9RHF7_9TELE